MQRIVSNPQSKTNSTMFELMFSIAHWKKQLKDRARYIQGLPLGVRSEVHSSAFKMWYEALENLRVANGTVVGSDDIVPSEELIINGVNYGAMLNCTRRQLHRNIDKRAAEIAQRNKITWALQDLSRTIKSSLFSYRLVSKSMDDFIDVVHASEVGRELMERSGSWSMETKDGEIVLRLPKGTPVDDHFTDSIAYRNHIQRAGRARRG